jgi:hypothetical protein
MTNVQATAYDGDGDPITYAWASSCGGSFGDLTAAATTFTAPATDPTIFTPCQLTVSVDDGRGGSNQGWLVITIGEPQLTQWPVFDVAFQSALSATEGQDVTFRVYAHDPQGNAIFFSWALVPPSPASDFGALGSAVDILDGASTVIGSQIAWTPPSPLGCSGTRDVSVKAYAFSPFPPLGGVIAEVFTFSVNICP